MDDLLQKCAFVFKRLTDYQYRFTLGRKGKLKEIVLGFGETDFHHLVGLHKSFYSKTEKRGKLKER